MQNKNDLSIGYIALSKIKKIEEGTTSTTDARVSPLSQSLGITYDSNNNVVSNKTNDNITNLQTRLTVLENRLSDYENHTHNYIDSTINDTSDGSGTEKDTTKTTGVVN